MLRMGCFCGKETIEVDKTVYYEKSRLGEGGFSVVDLVEEVMSGELFALKRISCHSDDDQKVAQQEWQMHKLFPSSKNILPCMGGEFQKTQSAASYSAIGGASPVSELLLVLPFYRRGTLQDELERRGAKNDFIREERVLRLLRGICSGLQDMHHAKPVPIAHRDLKPGNVLLTDGDEPILMDLGSADVARIDVKTSAQALALQDRAAERCSMAYRAPELFHVETFSHLDERTDIWSLGCLLYAMMYFKSPFDDVIARGDSIALAVTSGHIHFPSTPTSFSQDLMDLVKSLVVVPQLERPFIKDVIVRVEALMDSRQSSAVVA